MVSSPFPVCYRFPHSDSNNAIRYEYSLVVNTRTLCQPVQDRHAEAEVCVLSVNGNKNYRFSMNRRFEIVVMERVLFNPFTVTLV
jgi:hypothetical protein